jgi:hypothetical protein
MSTNSMAFEGCHVRFHLSSPQAWCTYAPGLPVVDPAVVKPVRDVHNGVQIGMCRAQLPIVE